MGEYKESKDNPLYHKYGVISNTRYMLEQILKYKKSVIPLSLTDMVCSSVTGYFWGFFGKFIIDVITSDLPREERVRQLLFILLIGLAIIGTVVICRIVASSKVWPRFIEVRIGVIRERVRKALEMDYEKLESPEMLDIHQRATQATSNNQDGIEGMMHILHHLGTCLVTTLVTFFAVLTLDIRLIIAMTVLALLSFGVYRYIIKKDKKEVWDRLSPVWRKTHYMGRVVQNFEYAKDIRLFSISGFLLSKLKKIHAGKEERIDHHHNLWNRNMIAGQINSVIEKVLVYGVLFTAALKDTDALTIGNFTLFLSLAMAFSEALITLLTRSGDYIRCSMQVDDLRTFLSQESSGGSEKVRHTPDHRYTLEFHDVSFRYQKSERDALSHLNLKLSPGERLAVVGLNGAGKTTMIKLLLRLYHPTEGTITLNGVDIRRFSGEDYYSLFSPVFQDCQIFAVTLGENVAMAPAQEVDRHRAEADLRQAGLETRLDSLEKGLDTQLLKVADENGIDLSGGEKQKLALARALYKNAPFVILDEPTAALDALAEKALYERFDTMIQNRTAVYISHRLASTRFCDRIAMFKDGRMVEYGTHDELMRLGGEYAHMFDVQARYYREGSDAE